MGLFGGSTKTTTKSEPWKPQGDALRSIFNSVGALYNQQAGTPAYEGDLYANMDPATAAAIQNIVNYNNSKGQQTTDQISKTGSSLAGSDLYQSALSDFNKSASGDPTLDNIAQAKAYASNPAIDGMIDAASRDVSRNLYENELPGIDRAASGTGNINSSRAGVAAGIAARGAQDQIGDISAAIRGNAYDRGLSLAEQARVTNLSAMGSSAGLYGQSVGQGLDALNLSNNMTLGNNSAAIDASRLNQQDEQGQLDADYQAWQNQDNRQWDLLNKYYSILGSNNWGGTSTQKTKSSGSILGSALGAASVAASFSDPRLKENVEKIGELEDGLGVYTYDYLWGEPGVGVMADEVEQLRPWAMGPTRGGFKTVNYAAL